MLSPQAWLALGFQHVGSGSSYEHLRFDLLFERNLRVVFRPAPAPSPAIPARPRRWSAARAYKIFSDSSGLYPMVTTPGVSVSGG